MCINIRNTVNPQEMQRLYNFLRIEEFKNSWCPRLEGDKFVPTVDNIQISLNQFCKLVENKKHQTENKIHEYIKAPFKVYVKNCCVGKVTSFNDFGRVLLKYLSKRNDKLRSVCWGEGAIIDGFRFKRVTERKAIVKLSKEMLRKFGGDEDLVSSTLISNTDP